MKDATYDTPEKQVALLERLGYDGMEKNGLDDFAEVQGELDRQGLKLFTVYVNVNLDPGQPAYDPRLPEVIRSLKGRETMLWLNVTSRAGTYAPSSREGDAAALAAIGEIADMAQRVRPARDALPARLVLARDRGSRDLPRREARPPERGPDLQPAALARADPPRGREGAARTCSRGRGRTSSRSASTARRTSRTRATAGTIWKSLIQPLGQGTFDTYALLETLVDLGFEGPVGLQCYNVPGDKAEILAQSMATWRSYRERMAR